MGCCSSKSQSSQTQKAHRLVTRTTQWANVQQSDYPPPLPPKYRKNDMYPRQCYISADTYVTKVPRRILMSSLKDLSDFLTSHCKTDVECARALFHYVTSVNVELILKSLKNPPPKGSCLESFLQLLQNNHAFLYRSLARYAGIPCVVITGISKNSEYSLGKPLDRNAIISQWNAIYLDEQWRLLDTFWASVCLIGQRSKQWMITSVDGEGVKTQEEDIGVGEQRRVRNEFYFLTDPDMFVCTHLPDDSAWQLLPAPVAPNQFEEFVYIREQFFKLGMYMTTESHQNVHLQAVDGEIVIPLGIPKEKADQLLFKYLIFSKGKLDKIKPKSVENVVLFEKHKDHIKYTISFPVTGEFRFDIFGCLDNEDDKLDLVCSYVLHCTKPLLEMEDLPDSPEIGWGPSPALDKTGLVPISHKAPIINVQNGQVQVQFRMMNEVSVRCRMKTLAMSEFDLENYVMVSSDKDVLTVTARLPKKGQYALKIYAKENHQAVVLPNVCNYLLKAKECNQTRNPFPRISDGVVGRNEYASIHLDVNPVSLRAGEIETEDQNLTLTFEASHDVSIMAEVQNVHLSEADLDKCISALTVENRTSFELSLETPGEYSLNVYAKRTHDPSRIHKVHSYKISFKTSSFKETSTAIPPAKMICTAKGLAEIPLPEDNAQKLLTSFSHCTANTPLDNKLFLPDFDKCIMRLNLPWFADYALDIYLEKQTGVLTFLNSERIRRIEKEEVSLEAATVERPVTTESTGPSERESNKPLINVFKLRTQLKLAYATDSIKLLKSAIRKFEAAELEDTDGTLKKARRKLQKLETERELSDAIASGAIYKLEAALEKAEKLQLQYQLSVLMIVARRMLDEKFKTKIKKMTQNTIAEVKSYQAPPRVVMDVMRASFLLLGESESSSDTWDQLRLLIGDTRKMKTRLQGRALSDIPKDVIGKAKSLLSTINRSQVQHTSETAETFFAWSMNVLKMAEESQINGEGDDGDKEMEEAV